MLSRVALVRTGVSEECIASIISMTRIGELGTTLAATSNRSNLLYVKAHISGNAQAKETTCGSRCFLCGPYVAAEVLEFRRATARVTTRLFKAFQLKKSSIYKKIQEKSVDAKTSAREAGRLEERNGED
jgi:hypothetical protein